MQAKLKILGVWMLGMVAGVLLGINFSAWAEKDAAEPLPVEELRAFANVFNAIKRGYVEPVPDKKLIGYAISGMVANLDPHSAYLDGDAYKDLKVSTQGEFGGLGIEVGMEDGVVKVVAPIEDTPAWRAGVKAGDLIIKLDDTAVRGMTLSDAVKRMRGKPGLPIRLTIARKGVSAPIEITVVRDKIRVQSVKAKLLENNVAYLRITQFQEETVADVKKRLVKLTQEAEQAATADKSKPELKGLVLDLRNDPGGLLNAAIGVSAAFLPTNAPVVSTEGRTEDAKRKFVAAVQDYARGQDPLAGLPEQIKTVKMVVLVNGGSASASEIVAGALQDNKRAVIMGTQTFGKGSVQTVIPLAKDAALKLTTARYFTPNGKSIQAKGITPDVVVEESANGETRERLREADLDHHLENNGERPAGSTDSPPAGKSKPATPARSANTAVSPPVEYGSANDYQLSQAINLLKALQVIAQ